MKQKTFIGFMVVTAGLTLLLAVCQLCKRPPTERANEPASSGLDTSSPESPRKSGPAPQPGASSLRRARSHRQPRPPEVVRVPVAQVLATVNQTPVQLKDLVPLNPQEAETAMTPREFDSRLNRAIEMAAISQAARAQAVELTPAQMARLVQISHDHQADLDHYRSYGLSWSSVGAPQIEFERRVLAAQMLEQNLVTAKAAVAPSPDPEIQARYEQARRELLDQLLAAATVVVHGP